MTEILNCIADAVLILLLGGTLVMAVRLDRALRVVGGDRAAFEALVNSLGSATNAVKLGIQTLRSEAERAAHQLDGKSRDADKMATDLSFLIDAADRAGLRLEQRLDTPPAVPDDSSRLAGAVRELKHARRYRRQKPADIIMNVVVPVAMPEASPGPTVAEWSEPTNPAPYRRADEAPANLRQLAGITTRRRVADPADVQPPELSEQNTRPTLPLADEAAFPATHIKLVG